MILRRFMQHVKEQNWFAVGLDVIVVIVGIFLGLQVTNWQERINEDNAAKEYLNRLHDDLQVDLETINHREKYWTQVKEYSDIALVYLEAPELIPDDHWKYLLAVFQSSQITPFEVRDITYKELQQTGQMLLLRDKVLRTELAEYYSFNSGVAAETLLRAIPAYRSHVRGLIPTDITAYIWLNCIAQDDINSQYLIPCDSPVTDKRAYEILARIRQDDQVLRLLRTWYNTNNSAIGLLPMEKSLVNNLIQSIQNQLSD